MTGLIDKYTSDHCLMERRVIVAPVEDRHALYEEFDAGGWRTDPRYVEVR